MNLFKSPKIEFSLEENQIWKSWKHFWVHFFNLLLSSKIEFQHCIEYRPNFPKYLENLSVPIHALAGHSTYYKPTYYRYARDINRNYVIIFCKFYGIFGEKGWKWTIARSLTIDGIQKSYQRACKIISKDNHPREDIQYFNITSSTFTETFNWRSS